jgi:hypothetical protein
LIAVGLAILAAVVLPVRAALAHDALRSPDVLAFGNASTYGSTSLIDLVAPIVAMARRPDGHGYWEVASDGGIFSFGDAQFFGSYGGGVPAEGPSYMRFVGMAPTVDGGGYWIVASGFCGQWPPCLCSQGHARTR